MVSDLVLSIYDASLEPQKWPDLLHSLAESIDARGAFIFDIEDRHGIEKLNATYFSSNYQGDLVQQYLTDHQDLEMEDQALFASHSRELDGIELVRDEVLAPSREALMQRANAQAMRDYGIFYRMGGLLNKDKTSVDRFALQFSESVGFPTGERLERLNSILPHMAKALNIGRHTSRLNQSLDILSDGYNGLRVGIALLDHRGELVFANHEFQRQMDAFGAFHLGPDKRLLARLDDGANGLAELLSNIQAHGRYGARPRKEALMHPINHRESALCIEVCPLTRPNFFNGEQLNGYALFSLDTSLAIHVDTDAMAQFFSLTRSETEVLDLLAKGMTNAEICEQRNRSLETVNTQVKSVLQKTMASSRSQLMRVALQYSRNIFFQDAPDGGSVTRLGDGQGLATS